MEELDDIMNEFVIETREGLDSLDRDLILLEEASETDELVSRIFRTVHTIKGSAGFLGLEKLGEIAHVGENLLSLVRDGKLDLTPAIVTALLAMADAIREIIGNVENEIGEGDTDFGSLTNLLASLADTSTNTAAHAPPDEQTPSADEDCSSPKQTASADTEPALETEAHLEAAPQPVEAQVAAAATTPSDSRRPPDTTIRVDVHLLDKLMNLVGELVLARNQILQQTSGSQDQLLTAPLQRLNHVTTELQEGVMKTRMQPIGNAWSKFPRVVRDLAISCAKNVRIEMEGQDTELDKTILESIRDPLTHAIRNGVDHGIESPEARLAAGKPEQGRLLLRAFHESGQVNIEIIDDGAGIDPVKIRDKAISKGLLSPDKAARMSDKELVNLVTLPGFSTAETITNVSGRGVGMDVVRTNIEEVGGTLDIHSVPGHGATIRIKIPLTLAIIPALTVTSAAERFAIPQVNLLELVRLEGEQIDGIESIGGASVYRLRDRLLPLVRLDEQLGRPRAIPAAELTEEEAILNIVVLQAGERPFGLVVDDVLDTEEIVVKPLGQQLKDVPLFAGAAIMGDGKVALILDVMGLATSADIAGDAEGKDTAQVTDLGTTSDSDRRTLLLIDNPDGTRCAMPMSVVARLEEFDTDIVETSGGQEVVQYRGAIMPLVRLSNFLGHAADTSNGDRMQVVVVRHDEQDVGVHVHRILDTVTDAVKVSGKQSTLIEGATTVEGRVTDILDVGNLVASQSGF